MDPPPPERPVGRRRALGALGTALSALLAGCPGRLGRSSPERRLTPVPVPTGTTTERRRSVPEGLENVPCPGLPGDLDHVTRLCCQPERRGYERSGFDALSLSASRQQATLPAATFRFTFRNEGDRTVDGLFPPFSLQKYVDDQWFTIRPRTAETDTDATVTGQSTARTWRLEIDNEATERLDPRANAAGIRLDGDATVVPVAGLGAGIYAFVVGGRYGDATSGDSLALATLIRLAGEPLAITPADTVQSVSRAGATATVTADPGLGPDRTYVLRARRRWTNPPRLVPEQIVRHPVLRTLLSVYAPSLETVVLHTRAHPLYPPVPDQPFAVGQATFAVETVAKETPN